MLRIKRILSLAEAKSLGFSEGFVSKTVDLDTKQIVAYPQGGCFDQEALNALAVPIHTFQFWVLLDSGQLDGPLEINAQSLEYAFIAMGLGCSYEDNWGGYRGLLRVLREQPKRVSIAVLTRSTVYPKDVQRAYQAAAGIVEHTKKEDGLCDSDT